MRSVKKLFLTTLALTLTSFLMRPIGVWFNVYLAGTVGSVGIGIFQLILSVYAMSKTHKLRAYIHKLVVERADIILREDIDLALLDNSSLVYLVVEQEGGDTCAGVTIDDSPIYRCCTAVLG